MKKPGLIYKLSLYLALAVLLVSASQYLGARIQLTNSYSPDLRGQEKNVVYGIQQAMTGLSHVYQPIDSPPFAFIQYTPIYYYFCASICNLFHLKPGIDLHEIYVLCRQINLILNIFSSLLVIYILIGVLGAQWEFALITGILLFLSSQSHSWAIRPDALKNVLFLLSLLFFLRWLNNKKIGSAILSSLFVSLAIFSKQDMVILAFTYLTFSFFRSNKRSFLQYFISLTGFGLLGMAIFTFIHGFSIWENLYWAVNNGASFSNLKSILSGYIGSYIYLIPLGIFVSLNWLVSKSTDEEFLLGIIVLFLFGFGCLACSKAGSLIAYFNETNTAIFISITYYISNETKQRLGLSLLVSLLSMAFLYQMASGYKPEMERLGFTGPASQENEKYSAASLVRNYLNVNIKRNETLYTNDPFLKNMLFQNCLLPMDDIVFFNIKAQTFDPAPYTQFYRMGHINYAIFKKGEPMEDILGQNFANFLPIKTVGNYIIYRQP